MSGKKRPTRLVNLTGDDEEESTPPVDIPKPSSRQHFPGSSKSAPSGRRVGPIRHASSLVEPVIDENDVISSSYKSDCSTMERRKEAAGGGLGKYTSIQDYGGVEAAGGPHMDTRGLEQSHDIEEDYEKIAMRHKRAEHATSNIETAIHVLKGNIGTGLLALPLAVRNAGLVIGSVGLLLMGIIATHCMCQLVSCARELCKRLNVQTLDYAEVARFAVLQHTDRHIWGRVASIVVNIFLLITQFGFCSVYFVFMAENLQKVFCEAFDVHLDRHIWIAILILPMVVLSWIRNLDELASLSMVANLCIGSALLIIVFEEINSFVTNAPDERAKVYSEQLKYARLATLPLFFGSVVYAFEGIGVVLPLENKMKTPQDAPRVLTFTMVGIILLYVIFGVLGYIVYGEEIEGSITLNLVSDNDIKKIFFNIAKLFYTYAILSSFLLQFYVPMDFLEPPIYEKLKIDQLTYRFPRHHDTLKFLIQITFRSVIVFFTAAIALAVPDLDDLISLIGAVASSALALIFPPLLSILVFWRVRHKFRWLGCLPWPVWVGKDVLIITLGVVGSLFGTYASINNIVHYFHHGHQDSSSC